MTQLEYSPPGFSPARISEFNVLHYGALGDGTTDDYNAIAATITACVNAGGGMVIVPPGRIYAIGSTIVINTSRIVLTSKTYGDGSHTSGTQFGGACLKWIGSAGGTMMQIAAIEGAANQDLHGNGVQGITFNGNNSAAIGLQLFSGDFGFYTGLKFTECTGAGLDLIPAQTLGDAVSVRQNIFQGIRFRTVSSTGVGVRVRGNGVNSNTSFNTFYNVAGTYKNGTGIELGDSDNNTFYETFLFRSSGGTGVGVDFTGDAHDVARGNTFFHLSPGHGGVTFRGTELLSQATHDNNIFFYDKGNSSPDPVLGTGVSSSIRIDNEETGGLTFFPTLQVKGQRFRSAWSTFGAGFRAPGSEYTDTTSSGAASAVAIHALRQDTVHASNAATYPSLTTLYIGNAPLAGTNVTVTGDRQALWVEDGVSRFDGAVKLANTVTIGGSLSAPAWTNTGIALKTATSIYTDTTSSGTVSKQAVHAFAAPILAASNPTTYTNAATVYIAGAPAAGTNVTLPSARALWVDSGITRLDGDTTITGALVATGGANLSGSLITLAAPVRIDAGTIATDTTTGLKIGTATNQKIAFFNSTPVVKQATFTQTYSTASTTVANLTSATLTDSSGGTADTTVQALPDPADAPADADALREDLVANLIPALRNNIADLTAQVNALRADLENAKQVQNALIDSNQAYGLNG